VARPPRRRFVGLRAPSQDERRPWRRFRARTRPPARLQSQGGLSQGSPPEGCTTDGQRRAVGGGAGRRRVRPETAKQRLRARRLFQNAVTHVQSARASGALTKNRCISQTAVSRLRLTGVWHDWGGDRHRRHGPDGSNGSTSDIREAPRPGHGFRRGAGGRPEIQPELPFAQTGVAGWLGFAERASANGHGRRPQARTAQPCTHPGTLASKPLEVDVFHRGAGRAPLTKTRTRLCRRVGGRGVALRTRASRERTGDHGLARGGARLASTLPGEAVSGRGRSRSTQRGTGGPA